MSEQEQEAPAGDDAAAGGEAAAPETTHQIRFVARTLDGVEITSAPISLKPGAGAALQAKVASAYWGHAQYLPGDTAYACANAFNAEGAQIKFIVESSSGGGWSGVANLKASVKDDKAVATWPVPADLAAGAKVRFRAKTVINEQTAIEFTIAAAAKGGGDDEAAADKPAAKTGAAKTGTAQKGAAPAAKGPAKAPAGKAPSAGKGK